MLHITNMGKAWNSEVISRISNMIGIWTVWNYTQKNSLIVELLIYSSLISAGLTIQTEGAEGKKVSQVLSNISWLLFCLFKNFKITLRIPGYLTLKRHLLTPYTGVLMNIKLPEWQQTRLYNKNWRHFRTASTTAWCRTTTNMYEDLDFHAADNQKNVYIRRC